MYMTSAENPEPFSDVYKSKYLRFAQKSFTIWIQRLQADVVTTTESGEIMFRLWARIFEDNHMIRDICIADDGADTRTHKIFRALEEACYQFDLAKPIWLDKNIADFKRLSKTRFTSDNFIEQIDFDYLEIQIIEED